MGRRYAVSGAIAADMQTASEALIDLLGKAITPGRVFWLRYAWWSASGTDSGFWLTDATAGGTAGGGVGTRKMLLPSATQPNAATEFAPPVNVREFPSPGLKFAAGCCISCAVSMAVTVGGAGGLGYEE